MGTQCKNQRRRRSLFTRCWRSHPREIVNHHLGLLMSTVNWTIRPTDPVRNTNEYTLTITSTTSYRSVVQMEDSETWSVAESERQPLLRCRRSDAQDGLRKGRNSFEQQVSSKCWIIFVRKPSSFLPLDDDGATDWFRVKGQLERQVQSQGQSQHRVKKRRVCH